VKRRIWGGCTPASPPRPSRTRLIWGDRSTARRPLPRSERIQRGASSARQCLGGPSDGLRSGPGPLPPPHRGAGGAPLGGRCDIMLAPSPGQAAGRMGAWAGPSASGATRQLPTRGGHLCPCARRRRSGSPRPRSCRRR
jgi:hypothetical protein